MIPDPIVDEVRAIRDAIAQEHGYDIDAIFEAFRRMQEASGRPHVIPHTRKAPSSNDSTLAEETAQQGIAAGSASRRR
ncbi:hypothetical protein WMF26_02025 [Sorangium sp. So ce185]|uniref:hypothetical protein n=1 Tax=Sorangium sp. So ce185 TaxID=3133287 RepID=UPI003F628745